MQKRKKRFGDRKDGRRLRTLAPIDQISPYIMVERNDASNFFNDKIDLEQMELYVRKKRKEPGLESFGLMHVLIAAYVRVVSQKPRLNRFIGGQRVYARNEIVVNMAIKPDMSENTAETIIKVKFEPTDTAADVYRKFNKYVEEVRNPTQESGFDATARILTYIPGVLKKFAVWFLKLLDYFGGLPKGLTEVSPFHGSMFITSMGSLGIPPIYHHLYNFGNVPVFLAFGAKRLENVLQSDGSVRKKKYIDYTVVLDERICDGFYYASALKMLRRYLANPSLLDTPPETVVEDID